MRLPRTTVLVVLTGLMAWPTAGEGAAPSPTRESRGVTRDRDLTPAEYDGLERRLIRGPAAALVKVLGRPDSTARVAGLARWFYTLDRGNNRGWLVVSVKDRRVVGMSHNERQTGVREDDFVGIGVGP